MKHFKYLSYVIRHKFYVYQEGRKLGVPRLQLLIHDWQKFTPAEWFPYVEKFYGNWGSANGWDNADRIMAEVNARFDKAWLHHQKLGGKHHWQYWVLVQDNGPMKAIEIPEKYRLEMIADWRGAGLALGKPDAWAWYLANKDKMTLHSTTRELVEFELSP